MDTLASSQSIAARAEEFWSSSWQIGSKVLLCVTLTHFVISTLWFLLRREKHPINGHSIALVLGCAISLVVTSTTIFLVAAGFGLSCLTYLLCVYNSGLICAFMYVARVWRIFINDRKQSKQDFHLPEQGDNDDDALASALSMSSVEEHSDATSSRSNRLGIDVRLIQWLTGRKLFVVACVVGIVVAVLEDIPFFLEDAYDGVAVGSPETCPELTTAGYVHVSLLGIVVFVVIFTLFKLKGIIDGYGIKTELARVSLWAIVVLINTAAPRHILQLVLTFITTNMILFHTVTWKVWDSHRRLGPSGLKLKGSTSQLSDISSEATPSKSSSVYTFESVLEDRDATEKFKQHLRAEWAVENLLFYQAAKQFFELCANGVLESREDRTRVAVAIYETFIDENGPSMVNLPSTTTKGIIDRVKNREETELEPNLFVEAQHEILRLMKKDSFVRFSVYFSYSEVFLSRNDESEEPSQWQRLRRIFCCCLDCAANRSAKNNRDDAITSIQTISARETGRYTSAKFSGTKPRSTRSSTPNPDSDEFDDRLGTMGTIPVGDATMSVNDYLDMLTAEHGSLV